MNSETEALLFDVVERLERSISTRDCPAIVVLGGHPKLAMSDYDYLRDDQTARAFEQRAAAKAMETGATRWVLAVPQVWLELAPGRTGCRAVSNHPLREGEYEVIAWMSVDADDGVDYGFVPYTRRPNGDPIFSAPEIFTTNVQMSGDAPGFTLLKEFLDDPEARPTSDDPPR